MKILISTSTLSHGGAQRVASNISLYLYKKYEIVIITYHNNISYPYKGRLIDFKMSINPNVGFVHKTLNLFYKYFKLRKVLKKEKPDIVLSFTEGPNIIALLNKITGIKSKFIVNSQIPPSKVYKGFYRIIYKFLISRLYNYSDIIISLSEGVKKDLVKNFCIGQNKIKVIYNPVDIEIIENLSTEEVQEKIFNENSNVILNVGRLCSQKNQLILIKAFKKIKKEINNAKLVFIGTGEIEKELRNFVNSFGLEEDVFFLGWKDNPFKYMKRADVFVLSSDYEGFGNVLVEAMACGCPVISTDCEYGPSEILDRGKYGILVPLGDENEMANAILKVLKNKNLKDDLSKKAKERAKVFDAKKIVKEYEEIFEKLFL